MAERWSRSLACGVNLTSSPTSVHIISRLGWPNGVVVRKAKAESEVGQSFVVVGESNTDPPLDKGVDGRTGAVSAAPALPQHTHAGDVEGGHVTVKAGPKTPSSFLWNQRRAALQVEVKRDTCTVHVLHPASCSSCRQPTAD